MADAKHTPGPWAPVDSELKRLHDANVIATNRHNGIAQNPDPARRVQLCLSHANELHQTACKATYFPDYQAVLREAARMLTCMAQIHSHAAIVKATGSAS